MNIYQEVVNAVNRTKGIIRATPLEHSPYLSQLASCQVYLKLENLQITGSFKLRGAANKLISLSDSERDKGTVTASSGNHGAAFAYVAAKLGVKGTIFLPENASTAKIEALKLFGADLQFHGNDCLQTEIYARHYAEKNHLTYVPPYSDEKVIGGQGTIAVEIERSLDSVDAVLVPVGGGGLISGIASYLKKKNGGVEIIGCQPENSPVMFESIKAGRIIEMESKPTLSDGSAGGIEQGAITFDICRKVVDDFILVSEDEIKNAIKLMLSKHYMLVEGSAAISLAAFLKNKNRFANKMVVLIVSGAKISLDKLRQVLD